MPEYRINEGRVEEFINHTKVYGAQNTYDTLTNYHSQFQGLSNKLKEFESTADPNAIKSLPNITSKDDIINIALNYLKKIDDRFYTMAKNVLDNYMITKNIQLVDGNQCTAKCQKEPDGRINLNIQATKDINGCIAIAQELINAGLYAEYYKQKQDELDRQNEFARKAAKKFIGYMMIDFLGKNSKLSPEQKNYLQMQALRETSEDVTSLETDEIIFNNIMQQDPQAFENNFENYTPENFNLAMERYTNLPRTHEAIDQRLKDIAEEGKTTHYLMGDVLADLSALEMRNQFYKSPDQTIGKLIDGAVNNYKIQQITGMNNAELINNSPNLIEHINDNMYQDFDSNATINEREQEELVMERQRTLNNYYKNN